MKLRTFFVDVGGRGGGGDILFLSGFNVERIIATARKTDAGATGQLYAQNINLKPYNAYVTIPHDDVPTAFYPFITAAANVPGQADGGTVAHEWMGGSLMTVSGGGGILTNLGPSVSRGVGCYGVIDAASYVTVVNGGLLALMLAENSGQSWVWECWVFRSGGGAAILYRESNAAGTVTLDIQQNAGGTLSVLQNGAVRFTSSNAMTASAWNHVCLSYNAATGQITPFIGAVAGTAAAYTRLTTWSGDRVFLNGNANNQAFMSHCACYRNVTFTADDCTRHINNMQQDMVSGNFMAGTANLSTGQGGTLLFSNDFIPGFDSASYTVRMPLTAICAVQTGNGVFSVQIDTWERETI